MHGERCKGLDRDTEVEEVRRERKGERTRLWPSSSQELAADGKLSQNTHTCAHALTRG